MQCKAAPYIESIGRHVRCGRCLACKIKFRNDWASRIYFEMLWHYEQTGQYAIFITLTYRDGKLPLTPERYPTLRKKEFQQWLKNTAKAIGVFRYFACGEYGKNSSKRAHYHVVLFPSAPAQASAFCARWQKHFGFTSAYPLRDSGCNYVTKYATKFMEFEDRLKDGQEPEFRISSRGPPLGQDFCLNLLPRMAKARRDFWLDVVGDVPGCIRSGGRIWGIPMFLRRKMRAAHGIPSTEVERIVRCPTHVDFIDYEEPERCPIAEIKQEKHHVAKAKQVHYRSQTAKL